MIRENKGADQLSIAYFIFIKRKQQHLFLLSKPEVCLAICRLQTVLRRTWSGTPQLEMSFILSHTKPLCDQEYDFLFLAKYGLRLFVLNQRFWKILNINRIKGSVNLVSINSIVRPLLLFSANNIYSKQKHSVIK